MGASAISIVRQAVNLDGYGSSPGFLGYFERKGRFSHGLVDRAIDTFLTFFRGDLSRMVLVSSLHCTADLNELANDYDVSGDDVRDFILPLSERKWLQLIDYSQFGTDYASPAYEEAIAALAEDLDAFALSSCAPSAVQQVCHTVMAIGGMAGHCFFVHPADRLVLYPHDDTGFGVVRGDPTAAAKGQAFLRSVNDQQFQWSWQQSPQSETFFRPSSGYWLQ